MTMRAAQLLDGEPVWGHAPAPQMQPGCVRIDVHCAGVNRADLMQAKGLYPPPPGASQVLGLEAAGTVVEVASDVTAVAVGDRGAALLSGGGYAEQVVCPAGHVLPVPDSMSFEHAAAMPEVLATVVTNLVIEAAMKPGERVLLHAGASGVGTAAIQLCRVLGNPVFVTVGNAVKIARCVELGADGGHIRHDGSFVDAVQAWAPDGVDVILDPVGAKYVSDNQRCLALGGRLVVIGLMGGRSAELDFGRLLVKRQRVIGSVLRSRSNAEKTRIMDQIRRTIWPRVPLKIQPEIDCVVPIERMTEALERLAGNQTVGKVVLKIK
jgi:putative PIG3 family NAD(P)H quinone oxidoreductase